MRLICPNCGAQYAVADDAIPSGGRDVQCSNCQHTWFETPGASATDMPPAQRAPAPPPQPKPQPVVPPVPDADRFSGSITDAFRDVVDNEKLAPAPQPPAPAQATEVLQQLHHHQHLGNNCIFCWRSLWRVGFI